MSRDIDTARCPRGDGGPTAAQSLSVYDSVPTVISHDSNSIGPAQFANVIAISVNGRRVAAVTGRFDIAWLLVRVSGIAPPAARTPVTRTNATEGMRTEVTRMGVSQTIVAEIIVVSREGDACAEQITQRIPVSPRHNAPWKWVFIRLSCERA